VKGDDITRALGDVGKKWTRQIKAEEKRPAARVYRASMYRYARTSLKEICYELVGEAWAQASDNGRLPTHWRQIFYVVRPLCDAHPDSDRPLTDTTFKGILESYLDDYGPGWDVLRGARGVFKEPHAADDDNGVAMSTLNVRNYLRRNGARESVRIRPVAIRFPTSGARNRIAAVLICEKEGFDELLQAEQIPDRYDLALMSTKGISARAARDLAAELGVDCFTLHDLDKNGFVMAAGFEDAVDLGLRMEDVEEWGLKPEAQYHKNYQRTFWNLRRNGATTEEAEFVAGGQRVELNMFTGPDFVSFVEQKLEEHGVEKVIPDEKTLAAAWRRAHLARRVNETIARIYEEDQEVPPVPEDVVDRIRDGFDEDDTRSWDEVLFSIAEDDDS
jgi:hypothetical protein